MAYTTENIANIKASGQIENYIAHETKMIEKLENARIEEGKQGEGSVSIAHLYGHYGIDVDDSAAPHNAVAWIVGSDWRKKWPVENFGGDQPQSLRYAKGALVSELEALKSRMLSEARARLAALEAA